MTKFEQAEQKLAETEEAKQFKKATEWMAKQAKKFCDLNELDLEKQYLNGKQKRAESAQWQRLLYDYELKVIRPYNRKAKEIYEKLY